MPMTGGGLAKLIEECGELIQVCGKRLAYYRTEAHPDGGPPLNERLQEEIADVMAACGLVSELHQLDIKAIDIRTAVKFKKFVEWHRQHDNNEHGIDAK